MARVHSRSKIDRPLLVPAVAVSFGLLIVPSSHGAVLSVAGRVSTAVQEFIDGNPASLTSDEEQTAADQALPITAVSRLDSTDLAGILIGQGQSFSEVLDPARLDQPNPQDLALEAACASGDFDVSYEVSSVVSESRTILFVRSPRDGIPRELSFRPDGTAEIRSRVFLSGGMLLWTMQDNGDPGAVAAEITISITREEDSTVLFETSALLDGGSGDDIAGPLEVVEVELSDLAEQGLDEPSLEVLRGLTERGRLRILSIPSQVHSYSYEVAADEAFVLTARLAIELRNSPGGTGVAVVIGRPFSNLAGFVENALAGVDGASLEQNLNKAIESAERPPPRPTLRLCGAGVELACLPIPLALLRRGRSSARLKVQG